MPHQRPRGQTRTGPAREPDPASACSASTLSGRLHPLTVDGIACGGSFDDSDSVGCLNPAWSPSGRQLVFRVNSVTGSVVVRADADGSSPGVVVTLGTSVSRAI